MKLYEMFNEITSQYREPKDDNTVLKLSDLRKTRLTLAEINKLRMANDVRKVEQEHKLETVSKQYKSPAPALGAV